MSQLTHRVIVVPMTLESIDVVQTEFDAWWTAVGEQSTSLRFSFETAVVEIATNIVEHTRRAEGRAGIGYSIELTADETQLTAVFRDNRMPADIDLSTITMPDLEDESGRGLAFALAALDSVEYRHVDGRNFWTLVCRR